MIEIFCKETTLRAFVSLMIVGNKGTKTDALINYRLLQINLENKFHSAVGSSLMSLGGTLGAVLDTIFGRLVKDPGGVASCPTFTGKNMDGFPQFCSARSQPGGIL